MEKSGVRETKWLFFILMISHICVDGIHYLIKAYATGGWIGLGISSLFALGAVFLMERCLSTSYGNPESFWGKRIYVTLATVLFAITVLNTAGRMKEFSAPLGETVLVKSPRIFILFVMGISALAVAFTGLEAITRYSLIAAGGFFVCFGVLVLANISGIKMINIYPLGGKNGLYNPFSELYIYSDVVYYFFLKGHLRDNTTKKYTISSTIIIVALTAIALTLFYSLAVPYPASAIYKYPFYRISTLANTSVVFQRLDGLVYIIWIFFSFVSSGSLALFALMILSDGLKIRNSKALCPVVVFLCFLLSLSEADFVYWGKFAMTLFTFVLFPGLLLWKKLRGRKE